MRRPRPPPLTDLTASRRARAQRHTIRAALVVAAAAALTILVNVVGTTSGEPGATVRLAHVVAWEASGAALPVTTRPSRNASALPAGACAPGDTGSVITTVSLASLIDAPTPPSGHVPSEADAFFDSAQLFSPRVAAGVAAAAAANSTPGCAAGLDTDGPTLARIWAAPRARSVGNGSAAIVRSAAAVAARQAFAGACISLHPKAEWAATGQRLFGPGQPAPATDAGFLTDRTRLAAHGSAVAAAVRDFAKKHGLYEFANWSASVGYAGPWIEDTFRATFARRAYYRASFASAVARADALVGAPDGAAYVIFTCEPGFSASSFRDFHDEARLSPGGAARCSSANATIDDVRARAAEPAAGAPRRQLFIAMPYDTELFHPFVPLFVPWENLVFAAAARDAVDSARRANKPVDAGFAAAIAARPALATLPRMLRTMLGKLLAQTLRSDVTYVTVTQRPSGPWLSSALYPSLLARTIVISSGGNGHVAIPLLARVFEPLPLAGGGASAAPGGAAVPRYGDAPHSLAFFGTPHAGARLNALNVLTAAVPDFLSVGKLPNAPDVWVPRVAAASTIIAAPRGVGATSFRLYEALQLGLVPLYTFDGANYWLPYQHPGRPAGVGAAPKLITTPAALPPPTIPLPPGAFDWAALAHIVENSALRGWANRSLPGLTAPGSAEGRAAWERMRAAAAARREAYFTYVGVMRHIWRFLEDPWEAELFCAPPPGKAGTNDYRALRA